MGQDIVIAVPDQVDGIVVDLWGHKYTPKPATKALAQETEDEVLAIQVAVDNDEYVAAVGAFFDKKLKKAAAKTPNPSTVLKGKWDASEVTLPQIQTLTQHIAEAERPI